LRKSEPHGVGAPRTRGGPRVKASTLTGSSSEGDLKSKNGHSHSRGEGDPMPSKLAKRARSHTRKLWGEGRCLVTKKGVGGNLGMGLLLVQKEMR